MSVSEPTDVMQVAALFTPLQQHAGARVIVAGSASSAAPPGLAAPDGSALIRRWSNANTSRQRRRNHVANQSNATALLVGCDGRLDTGRPDARMAACRHEYKIFCVTP
jgi:hypothetical protein